MSRDDLVLAVMSAAHGRSLTPVQVQKLFFLIDKRIADAVGGPHFDFQPYDYGPFDADVYRAFEGLAQRGLAGVEQGAQFRTRRYHLTQSGQAEGDRLLSDASERARGFIVKTCGFVLNTSFNQLVSAIYKAYPEMRARSVFRGA